eukprot:scaffold3827_cov191-Ochromonas_danica.AAC.5
MRQAIELPCDLDYSHLPVKGNDKNSCLFGEKENSDMEKIVLTRSSSSTSHDNDTLTPHPPHCHSGLSTESNENKRKMHRRLLHYRTMQMTFKRVMKNDVRKLFPAMYCNALNKGDFKLFHKLISSNMISQCEFNFQPLPQLGLTTYRTYEGSDQYASRAPSFFAHLPDYALIPLGSRIIRKLYEDVSIVELYANAKATRLIYPEGQQQPDCEEMTSASDALIQPMIVSVDFYMKIAFHFNTDGYVVKTVTSTVNLVPSFVPVV